MEQTNTQTINAENYVEGLEKAKQARQDEIDALQAQNKILADALAQGVSTKKEEPVVYKSAEQIKKEHNDLMKQDKCTNLDYITYALDYRDAVLRESNGKIDVFVGMPSSQYQPSEDDKEEANNTATVLRQVVDAAEGDPDLFNAYYNKAVVDDPLLYRKFKK